MAITALNSASTALSALNTQLDVIAINLANANTMGFKGSRVNFQDLIYLEQAQPGTENANGDQRPTGLYVGLGVKISGTQVDFSQGSLLSTNRPLDVAIEGQGFLRVLIEPDRSPSGQAFTRAGNLLVNSNGELVMANDEGRRLDPPITLPPDTISMTIGTDGRVLVLQPGATEPTEVGQIEVTAFINPAGLKQLGENLYVESAASGPPITGTGGEEGRGLVRQGFLEASNVDPTKELIELIRAQRAFEMNSQTIRAADESLRTIAQLRR